MKQAPGWQEVESEVYRPGRWLALAIGLTFFLLGAIGFLAIGNDLLPGIGFWIAKSITAVFALLGGAVLAWSSGNLVMPVTIRHAGPGVLPNVPTEPVMLEGSTVHGRVTHELVEDSDRWQFRPAQELWRNDMTFLLGFGIPFLTLLAGLLSWLFHNQGHVGGWPLAILLGISLTALCGGSAFVLIGMMMRSGYRRLCSLSIPRNGDDLELDLPEEPDAGLKRVFRGETKWQRLAIPRDMVAAVQLCPWKHVVVSDVTEITWAVQGSLVLASSAEGEYKRQPILLTSDFVGGARLMQGLAETLGVPFLFCADAEGWMTEAQRAKMRPPLRSGGSRS